MRKAYQSTYLGVDCVMAAETASRARRLVFHSAREANYVPDYLEIRVQRCPKLDSWAQTVEEGCFDPVHVLGG